MTIDHDLYLEHLGLAGSLAISLFVLLGLALRLYETPDRRMFLWAMVAFFTINSLDMLDSLLYGPVLIGPDALYQWQDVLIPGFILTLYFYVRGLTSSTPSLSRRDLLHLLPFAIAFLCLAPRLLQPGAIRRNMSTSDLSPAYKQLAELGENTFWAMWVVFLIFYGGLSVRRLYRHKHNIRTLFSDLEGKTLRWLDALVATIFLLAFIVIVDEIGLLMGRPEIRAGWVSAAFDLILAGSFGIFALRAVPPLPQWSAEVLPETPPAPLETPQPDTENRRYARSGLQPEDLDRYAQRLEQRVAQNQLWRDHDINLRRLAAEIAVPSIHLSEVLNTRLGMSFYDYINQCRISDACALLIETEMTILEISETVGFNAKSTFNTSFKKITGQTPSQWRRTHQP